MTAAVMTYDARTCERIGAWWALRLSARTLVRHWPQIRVSMIQYWVNQYRDSYLGAAWGVLMAIVPISVFWLLYALGIFASSGGGMHRAVYVAAGLTVWMLIAETITLSINGLKGVSHSLADAQTPLLVPLVSQYGRLVSDTLIRYAVIVIMMFSFGQPVGPGLLLGPLLFVPVIAFGMGLGLLLAALNVVLPDVTHITGMILRYGIFFCHAVWPLPQTPPFRLFNMLNLPAILVDNVRDGLVLGVLQSPGPFAVCCAVSFVCLLLGLRTFHRLEPHLMEHL